MAIFIDEKRMVNDTVFQYEQKFHSPMSRFIDKTPTFVTYFAIADDASTTDEGFLHVDDFIGNTSPMRFKRIENFPIYGLEQVILQLDDTEQGLDTSYEGDGTLINCTIVPKPNEFFMIQTVHDFYIFRVTAIANDNIMKDNYYQITFRLEYNDREKATWLNKQSVEKYQCIMENIGTDKKCIIRTDIAAKISAIEKMYDDIAETYISIFYSDRYNCFLGEIESPCTKVYDPFQTEFVLKHDLFNRKNQLDVIIPTEHFTDSKRRIKYERSIYRFFERRDLKILSPFYFTLFSGMSNKETGFYRYHDETIFIVDICYRNQYPENAYHIFSDEFMKQMETGYPALTKYGQILIDYIRNDDMTIDDIPMDLNDELLLLNAEVEIFFIVPIILYIIRSLIHKALEKDLDYTTVEV